MEKAQNAEAFIAQQQRAIASNPDCGTSHYNLAVALLGQGKIEAAEHSLLAAIDCSPGIKALEKATVFNFRFVQAFATLANAYLMNGQVKESIEANLKALKISPDFAVAHNNLAIAYLEDGQPALALEHANKARKLGYEVAPEIMKELEPHRA
ncbi:MAG: tetratricopeptide repeat protein [Desulfosarcina sp.]|nr:tetratricopeptide repeat protein [Desulfosarcina sp.]MBC2765415.1 tetratricopeptide repeat protein [Desulfosarcina sp.]